MEKNFYSKIAEIQKEIGKMQKDTKGYNYQYFDINQLLEKLKPLLEKHDLILLQPIKNGEVISAIIDTEDNKEISSSLKLPEGVKPQDMGSAITYYRRYTLVSLLAIEAEDDDGAKATKKEVKKETLTNNSEPF
jgi:hypothetical protein